MDDEPGGRSLFEDIFPSTGKHEEPSNTRIEETGIRAVDKAAELIHRALNEAGPLIRPGAETGGIAEAIESGLLSSGTDKRVLISISPEYTVWHGIPDHRVLRNGEIVTVDIACSVGGWWADVARTFAVGEIDDERRNLMLAAWEGTRLVSSMMKAGSNGSDIHKSLSQHCASRGVVLIPEGAGHAIGRQLHEPPSLTYDGRTHNPLEIGRLYTAEPIFTSGNGTICISPSGISETLDRKPSAHFEVTVLVDGDGARLCGAPDWMEKQPC